MAAATKLLTGIGAGTYANGGTYGSPTWNDQTAIKSVKPAYPWDFAETLSRATPIKLYGKTLVELSLQVMMRADPADAMYAAWIDAHWSRTTVLDLLVLNAKITIEGARGIRGEFLVSLSDDAQEIEGSIYSTFDLKPTLTANGYPKSVTMGASSTPTFTTIAV
jgi:hypothetical protein